MLLAAAQANWQAIAIQVLDALGYRGKFAALVGVGAEATLLVVVMVPETLEVHPIAGLFRSTSRLATRR